MAALPLTERVPACRDEPITAILPLHNGEIWLGFENGGIARGLAGKFCYLVDPHVLGDKAIRAMHEDSAGRIWAGTADGHLACFVARRFLKWDLHLESADESINGILTDDDGGLWISTGRAIYHVVKQKVESALKGRAAVKPQIVF